MTARLTVLATACPDATECVVVVGRATNSSTCAARRDTIGEVGPVAESTNGGGTWPEQALGPGGPFARPACGPPSGDLVAGTPANGAATLAVLNPDLLGPKGWSESYVGRGNRLAVYLDDRHPIVETAGVASDWDKAVHCSAYFILSGPQVCRAAGIVLVRCRRHGALGAMAAEDCTFGTIATACGRYGFAMDDHVVVAVLPMGMARSCSATMASAARS